ncbi:MAG: ABC transporter permease [Bacteroidota bacterium]|nr:ABC transporter permease [Bacteroidota bacterium]
MRGKEVGIRKVLGGKRNQLVFQFLSETFLITFTATLIAFLMAELLLNSFQELIGVTPDYNFISDPNFEKLRLVAPCLNKVFIPMFLNY